MGQGLFPCLRRKSRRYVTKPPKATESAHPKQSCLLLGPRGTGKSTWLRAAFPDAIWLDLLDPALQRNYLARPERLRDLLKSEYKSRRAGDTANTSRASGTTDTTESTATLVIDEIQKVPALLDVLHDEIEQRSRADKPPLLAVLTGSSARKLRRGASNLLVVACSKCLCIPTWQQSWCNYSIFSLNRTHDETAITPQS